MKRVVRRQGARQDLVEIFRYHADQAGLGTARRFRAQAESTFAELADSPGIGTRYEPESPALADLRVSRVSHFTKYLVYYRVITDGIEIVRVLHGARDVLEILTDEFGDD